MTEGKLRELFRKMGLAPFEVLRKGEAKYKELGINEDTPPGDIVKYIVENPSLLQRPIVEVDDKAVLARPIDKALELINSSESRL